MGVLRRRQALASLLVTLSTLSACGNAGIAEDSSLPAFTVDAHCGVQYINIEGVLWETKRRDDGNGNPPKGWPQAIKGRLDRVDKDTAVFTSEKIPERLVFRPAPDATYLCR